MRLIDADALIDDLMERYCKECNKRRGIKNGKYRIIYEIGEAPCRACEVDDVKAELEEAPTADVTDRKVGKWVVHHEVKNIYGGTCIECSECREKYVVQHIEDEKFCRNCGARMRGDEG